MHSPESLRYVQCQRSATSYWANPGKLPHLPRDTPSDGLGVHHVMLCSCVWVIPITFFRLALTLRPSLTSLTSQPNSQKQGQSRSPII
ncbi:hypothetical protein BDR03DRAFT_964289, partial [Suillus americanus]